jgi:chromosome segregation ATPase
VPDLPPIVVFHDDHEECDKQLRAAQATIRSLTAVVEQAEAHVEDRDQKVAELAADLVETRSQFADAQKQIEALRRELDATLAWSAELFNERNEQRSLVADFNTRTVELSDEVARLNATIVRLTNGGSIDG